MKTPFTLLSSLVCASLLCASQGFSQDADNKQVDLTKSRTWTSTAGSKMEGAFVGVSEGKVELKTSKGKSLMVPAEQLSQADRDFLGLSQPVALFRYAKEHPLDVLVSQKGKEGVTVESALTHYQGIFDYLTAYVPKYNLPKDLFNAQKGLNSKYASGRSAKEVPLAERRNLFTNELMVTKSLPGEPVWETVTQTYVPVGNTLEPTKIALCQFDVLKAGDQKKICIHKVTVYRKAQSRKNKVMSPQYSEWFDNKGFVSMGKDASDDKPIPQAVAFMPSESLLLARTNEAHTFFVECLFDKEGKLSDGEGNALVFYASAKPIEIYSGNFDWLKQLIYSQEAYDATGQTKSLEEVWKKNTIIKKKPEGVAENVLNVIPKE